MSVDSAAQSSAGLPELQIRPIHLGDHDELHAVREFCLNVLMQRVRLSNTYIYTSPIWLSGYTLAMAWSYARFSPHSTGDWGRWLFLAAAISASFLIGVDYFTYKYYERLTKEDHEQDQFLSNPALCLGDTKQDNRCVVAYFAGSLVGTCVTRRPLKPQAASREAELSHWNIKARYRSKGLGSDLLHTSLMHLKSSGVAKVKAQTSTIQKRARLSLAKDGFKLIQTKPTDNIWFRLVGVTTQVWELDLKKWDPPTEETS
ncbi:hypothetical protein PYCC9005_000054 [Savitreella phatthalungensis]